MNDFDRLLELELARMLDSVVRTAPPPRSSPPGRLPVVRLFRTSGSLIGPVATLAVLGDEPSEQRAEVALPQAASTPSPAILS